MIVVSDTSPITGLLTVGEAHILTRLFGEVFIPEAVCDELLRSHPHLPEWFRVGIGGANALLGCPAAIQNDCRQSSVCSAAFTPDLLPSPPPGLVTKEVW